MSNLSSSYRTGRESRGLRAFRFGAGARTASSRGEWEAKARQAEDLGYSTFLVPDHFADNLAGRLGPIAGTMYAAAVTSRLRIGSLVFNSDVRHPILLAQEVATLDLLSGGRFEYGIGCGWLKEEYVRAGLSFDAGRVRVARLEEAVRLIKSMFSDGKASVGGANYAAEDEDGQPKPIQRPHPDATA